MPVADENDDALPLPSLEALVAGKVAREEAARRFVAEGKKAQQSEVHLRAEQAVAYRAVAETLADASKAGLSKIGFISEPEGR